MAKAKYFHIQLLLTVLSVSIVVVPSWPQDLSNIGDSYKQYQEMQRISKQAEEAAMKKQNAAIVDVASTRQQQQSALDQNLDPIAKYMLAERGLAGKIPAIFKTQDIPNPGEYVPLIDTVYVNPSKFNDPSYHRDFTRQFNVATNANSVILHETGGHKSFDESGGTPPDTVTNKQDRINWEEKNVADKIVKEYQKSDKNRFDSYNSITSKMVENAAKEGRKSTVTTHGGSYVDYMNNSPTRDKALLDSLPTTHVRGDLHLPSKQYMSAQDQQDMNKMMQNAAKVQELGHTVISRGRTMTQAESNAYLNQMRALNEETRNIAMTAMQRDGAYMQNLGPDASKINPAELQNHAVGEIGWTAAGLGADLAEIPGGGTALMTGRAANSLWQAHRVGTGQVGPEALRGTIPHIVQAWDAQKGARNLPYQTSTTSINSVYDNGFLRSQTQGARTTQKSFSTTAPGVIGNYGFDPATDATRIRRSTQSVTHTTIGTPSPGFFNAPSHRPSIRIPVPTPPRTRRIGR